LFFVTAVLYAAGWFGGGSTYNALLVLNGTDYRVLPAIALTCNIVVVSGGLWRFSRGGHVRAGAMAPFLAASMPAAWVGGRVPVSETLFVGLLGAALLVSGLRLAFQSGPGETAETRQEAALAVALPVGGAIGLLAGLVGIGGGIFLAPVLYLMRWGTPREIAAGCSLFILANSLSGLTGQVMKLQDLAILSLAADYWALPVIVLVGGQIGSWAATRGLKPGWVKRLTAILILYVAARLIWEWLALIGWRGA
jgi:uncharacterized membrane protein YfcA